MMQVLCARKQPGPQALLQSLLCHHPLNMEEQLAWQCSLGVGNCYEVFLLFFFFWGGGGLGWGDIMLHVLTSFIFNH